MTNLIHWCNNVVIHNKNVLDSEKLNEAQNNVNILDSEKLDKAQNNINILDSKKHNKHKYYNYYSNSIKNFTDYLLNNGSKNVNWCSYYFFRFLPEQARNIYYGYFGNLFDINCCSTIYKNDLIYINIINLIFIVVDHIYRDIENVNKYEINNLFIKYLKSLNYEYPNKYFNEYANKLYNILKCFDYFYVNIKICDKKNFDVSNINMQNNKTQIDYIQNIIPELFCIYKKIMNNKQFLDDMVCLDITQLDI